LRGRLPAASCAWQVAGQAGLSTPLDHGSWGPPLLPCCQPMRPRPTWVDRCCAAEQALCIAAAFGPEDWPLLIVCPSTMKLVWADAGEAPLPLLPGRGRSARHRPAVGAGWRGGLSQQSRLWGAASQAQAPRSLPNHPAASTPPRSAHVAAARAGACAAQPGGGARRAGHRPPAGWHGPLYQRQASRVLGGGAGVRSDGGWRGDAGGWRGDAGGCHHAPGTPAAPRGRPLGPVCGPPAQLIPAQLPAGVRAPMQGADREL
jgi:hypothetical protein